MFFSVFFVQPFRKGGNPLKSLLNPFVEHFVADARGQRINGFYSEHFIHFCRFDDIIGVAHLPKSVKTVKLTADDSLFSDGKIPLKRVDISLEENQRQRFGIILDDDPIGLFAAFGRNMLDNSDFQSTYASRNRITELGRISPVDQP